MRAQAKWVHTSPRKARLVVEHIRGRSVPEARTVLAFTTRAAARDVEKVLRSAVANAEANHGLLGDDLYVSSIVVDEGPTLKRWRARARGRVARIHKRTCHITLELLPITDWAAARPKRVAASSLAAEEKPKRAPGAGKRQADAQGETPLETPATPEAVAETEKPKRARTPRRKKTEEA